MTSVAKPLANSVEQKAHSRIGASSYHRWKACPGSVRLSEGITSPESPYAKEGTLAHEIAADILEHHFFKPGERATIPLHVTAEMMAAVKVYTEFVKKEAHKANADVKKNHVLIEHRFDLSSVYPGLFGTADAVIYDPGLKKLIVMDYKHGQGIAVDVEQNVQLMYYGLGALLSTGFPCATVELVIVQPRCDHEGGGIRKWAFSSIELLDFAADLAHDAAKTEEKDAPVNPGEHCRFCPAAATNCDVIHKKALVLAKDQFSPALSYDPAKLDQALRFLPTLESWIKSVREFAYGEALHGRAPEGWKLVSKRPMRKWSVDEKQIVSFMKKATFRDEDDFYEKKLKSPAQMEKLNNKDVNVQLREFISTVSSGYVLAPIDDKRPAATVDAASDFTQIEGNENE